MKLLEKREYDRDQLTLPQQALRIVDIRYKGERPDDKEIEALAGPEEIKNRVRALFDERRNQKPKIGKPLSTQSSMAPRARTWEKRLDRQATSYLEQLLASETHGYEIAHSALTDGGLYVPEDPEVFRAPVMERVMDSLEQLTPEEVELLKKLLIEPELSIEPMGLNWRKYTDNLDTGTSMKYGTHFLIDSQENFNAQTEFNRQDEALGITGSGKITGWNVCVGEGSKEGPENHMDFLRNIIAKWEGSEARAAGFRLPTHQSYALAQKRELILASRDPCQIQGKELMDVDGASLLERADNGMIVCPDGSAITGSDGWRVSGLHRADFSGRNAKKGHCSGIRFRPQIRLRVS